MRLERFQGVKFKSEKKRCKNKKEQDEKVRILHFYWSEIGKLESFAISIIKTCWAKRGQKMARNPFFSKNYL